VTTGAARARWSNAALRRIGRTGRSGAAGPPAARLLGVGREGPVDLDPVTGDHRALQLHDVPENPDLGGGEIDVTELAQHPARFDRVAHRRAVGQPHRIAALRGRQRIDHFGFDHPRPA
jgi:hypothetical protein